MGNVLTDPRGVDSRGLYMGALDGRTPYGDVIAPGRRLISPSRPRYRPPIRTAVRFRKRSG